MCEVTADRQEGAYLLHDPERVVCVSAEGEPGGEALQTRPRATQLHRCLFLLFLISFFFFLIALMESSLNLQRPCQDHSAKGRPASRGRSGSPQLRTLEMLV